MARKHSDNASPKLEEILGTDVSPARVNRAAEKLLRQMGGGETAATAEELRRRLEAETKLAKLGTGALAHEMEEKRPALALAATLPEDVPENIAAFIDGLGVDGLYGELDGAVLGRTGVRLEDFPAAVVDAHLAQVAAGAADIKVAQVRHENIVHASILDQAA